MKEALYFMGNLSLKEKDEAGALKYYEKFLAGFDADMLGVVVRYNIGEIEYSRNNYKAASENYKKALALIESAKSADEAARFTDYVPKLRYSLGWCAYSSGDYNGAIENFSICHLNYKDFSNWADASLRLGISYFNVKKYKEAETAFRSVKSSKKADRRITDEADYYLGLTLQKSGAASGALEAFERLSNDTSEIGAESAYMSAVIVFDQKKYEDAISKFSAFVKRFKNSQRAQYAAFNIGLSYFNLARYKEAEDSFVAFLKDYPGSSFTRRAWFNLGEISVLQKKYQDAVVWFSKIPDDDQNWLEAQTKVCDVYMAEKNAGKLMQKYDEIMKKIEGGRVKDSESIIPALFKMGKLLTALAKKQRSDDAEKARITATVVKIYEKIIAASKSARNVSDARYKLAVVYFSEKQYEKSRALLETLAKESTGGIYNIYEVRELLGRALMSSGKNDEALIIFDEIVKAQDAPDHVKTQAKLSRATALYGKKSYEAAVEAFETLAAEAQDVETLAGLHYQLAKCYGELSKHEDAIRNLLKIEILFKDTEIIDEARIFLLELYVKTKQRKDAKSIRDEILKSQAPKSIKEKARELFKN